MSDALRIDAEDKAVIQEARDAAAEYANAKSYPDVMSAQERLRSMGVGAITALLAENERLQRERSEWCDQADRRLTDYMTQQRDLLAENAALRERLTLTPEKTATAYLAWEHAYASTQNTPEGAVRRALLAAGMEEEQ